jgi:hypothetical protein
MERQHAERPFPSRIPGQARLKLSELIFHMFCNSEQNLKPALNNTCIWQSEKPFTDTVCISINVAQYNETSVMHCLLNLLRIKAYMFLSLLAHPQEAVHNRHFQS